jgi:SAM-dependent methyltransferase
VTEEDRRRWDDRHAAGRAPAPIAPPRLLAPWADRFPTSGRAVELACGGGGTSVWLARRGLEVRGWDVSPVAVEAARRLAHAAGVADRCRFAVVDLDDGLPDGPAVDLVVCHLFRDPRLDRAVVSRLAPGGLLALAARSEVGAGPGRFRVRPGELPAAFSTLEVVAAGEGEGEAWLLARAPGGPRDEVPGGAGPQRRPGPPGAVGLGA